MSDREPVVRAENVSKLFATQKALDEVSLDVHQGQTVCIVGQSGSGKSTFLRCVNHLESISSGRLLVNGELVGYRQKDDRLYELRPRESASRRAAIGMVFQHLNLFPHMSVLRNLCEPPIRVRHEEPDEVRERARIMLDRVGLLHKADAYPRQLSGGEQQRVAIARALTMRPKLLLFDEPTSALDPELVREVLAVMREVSRSGLTMMVVTHEMGFAREVADQVAFMDHGRLIEMSSPQSFFERPESDRAREFLSKVL